MDRRAALKAFGTLLTAGLVPQPANAAMPASTFPGVDLGADLRGDPRWLWLHSRCTTLREDFIAPAYNEDTTLTVDDWPDWSGIPAGTLFFSQSYNPVDRIWGGGIDLVKLRIGARTPQGLTLLDCFGLVWPDYSYGTKGFDAATSTQRYIFRRSKVDRTWMMPAGTVVPVGNYVMANDIALGMTL